MKKVFCSFGFMVVLGSLFFASCSKEKDAAVQPAAPQISQGAARTLETPALPEGPVTLNLMGGAHLVSTTEAALKGYLKENPNVTINFEKYSYAEYPVKMRLQFASGDSSPDVALIHDIFIPQFIDAEWLMDLSGMIPYDQVLPFLGNASRGDKTYGLTNQASNYVFMYRQDVYDQFNLKPPVTWDEYYEQGLLLKQHGYYAGALNPNGPSGTFLIYMGMLGGSLFDQNGNVSLNKGVEALKMIQKALEAGIWHNSDQANDSEYWTAFNEGKIAACPGLSFEAARYLGSADPAGAGYGKLRLVPAMRFSSDGPESYALNTEYFAINAKSKNSDAARHLVHWLTLSEEGCEAFANVDSEGIQATYTTGYLPGIQRVAQNGGSSWEVFGGQQVVADISKILLAAKPTLPYKDARTPEAESIIGQILGETLVNKQYTPEQAVEEMRSSIARLD